MLKGGGVSLPLLRIVPMPGAVDGGWLAVCESHQLAHDAHVQLVPGELGTVSSHSFVVVLSELG